MAGRACATIPKLAPHCLHNVPPRAVLKFNAPVYFHVHDTAIAAIRLASEQWFMSIPLRQLAEQFLPDWLRSEGRKSRWRTFEHIVEPLRLNFVLQATLAPERLASAAPGCGGPEVHWLDGQFANKPETR